MPPASAVQSKMVLYLIMVAGLVGGYFYYSQISAVGADIPPVPQSDLDSHKDLVVSFEILDDPRYKALRTFGELPVNPGTTGKQDPFSAF